MRILVIYDDTEIKDVSVFMTGTAVVTSYYFAVGTKESLQTQLSALGIEDLSLIQNLS